MGFGLKLFCYAVTGICFFVRGGLGSAVDGEDEIRDWSRASFYVVSPCTCGRVFIHCMPQDFFILTTTLLFSLGVHQYFRTIEVSLS